MIQIWAIEGIPEVVSGDDVATLILAGVSIQPLRGHSTNLGETGLQDGDILAITSKIVSKAEGRTILAADREDAITAETVRLVAQRGHTRIVENTLGLVMAAAGVDSSNTPEGTILLLPVDPDASARAICASLREATGLTLGVIITDTLGRPWRNGQMDVAIGAAGVRVLDDLRGTTDAGGRVLDVTVPAVADELASAADLVKGKSAGLPVAVIRGMGHLVGDLDLPGARSIVRASEEDMFRLGSKEAFDEGYRAGIASS